MSTNNTSSFAFNKENYKFLFIGIGLTILGFILMTGGAAENANEFDADALYSHVRITLAPFLVILGYALVIYAIMKKRKTSNSGEAIKEASTKIEEEKA